MEALSAIPIEDLIPHRPPMILVDRMLAYLDGGAICEVTIRQDHVFMVAEGVPAYIGMELMAQTLAAMNGYQARIEGRPMDVGFLLGTPRLQSDIGYFKIGQRLRIEVRSVWGDDELRQFDCLIADAETEVVLQKATVNAFVPKDLEGYLNQERPQ